MDRDQVSSASGARTTRSGRTTRPRSRTAWAGSRRRPDARAVGELVAFAKQAAADGFETAVLLGMGGSSLAPEVFARTFGVAEGALELTCSTRPTRRRSAAAQAASSSSKTLFIVASKSGHDERDASHFAYFWERAAERAAVHRDHRSRHAARGARARARLPPHLLNPPRSAAATRRCRTSASCRRR